MWTSLRDRLKYGWERFRCFDLTAALRGRPTPATSAQDSGPLAGVIARLDDHG
jgi:hypothetical protein